MGKFHPLDKVVSWTTLLQKPSQDKAHPNWEAGADSGKGHELPGQSIISTSTQWPAILLPLTVNIKEERDVWKRRSGISTQDYIMKVWKCYSLSCVWFFVTPWTVSHQAPLSMEFSRQYWRGLPFPSPGDLPDPGNKPGVSCIASRFFTIWATRTTFLKRSFQNVQVPQIPMPDWQKCKPSGWGRRETQQGRGR